jgi:hypothetical protein
MGNKNTTKLHTVALPCFAEVGLAHTMHNHTEQTQPWSVWVLRTSYAGIEFPGRSHGNSIPKHSVDMHAQNIQLHTVGVAWHGFAEPCMRYAPQTLMACSRAKLVRKT